MGTIDENELYNTAIATVLQPMNVKHSVPTNSPNNFFIETFIQDYIDIGK